MTGFIALQNCWRTWLKASLTVLFPLPQKHVDFVLLNKQSFAVLRMIELDDSSHNHHGRKKA